jgi:ribose transport system permease protein
MIALLVLTFAFFSAMSGATFLTMVNLKNILNSMVVTAMLTVGAGCILISGHIDFSAGYVGTMTGVILATFVTNLGWPLYYALPIALVAAAAIGVLNATLVHQLNFQSFIATLATGLICKGLALVVGLGKTIAYKEPILTYLGTGKIFKFFPVAIFLAIFVFIVYGIVISKTTFGRSVFLIGGNPQASRLAGLKPKKKYVHTLYKQRFSSVLLPDAW